VDLRAVAFGAALLVYLAAPHLASVASSPLVPFRRHIALGAVRPGERVQRQFRLANLSLRDVRVLGVHADCGCIASVADSPRVGPFQIVTIQASFEAGERPGAVHHDIFVKTDDPQRPYVALKLDGRVVPAAGR
jgi:hypothetical protein